MLPPSSGLKECSPRRHLTDYAEDECVKGFQGMWPVRTMGFLLTYKVQTQQGSSVNNTHRENVKAHLKHAVFHLRLSFRSDLFL